MARPTLIMVTPTLEASIPTVPTIVVQHHVPDPALPYFQKGTPGWELHPEIRRRPCDLIIEKTLPGSFTGTSLEAWLQDREIKTVTIAGYMTHMCCDTTARAFPPLKGGAPVRSSKSVTPRE